MAAIHRARVAETIAIRPPGNTASVIPVPALSAPCCQSFPAGISKNTLPLPGPTSGCRISFHDYGYRNRSSAAFWRAVTPAGTASLTEPQYCPNQWSAPIAWARLCAACRCSGLAEASSQPCTCDLTRSNNKSAWAGESFSAGM